MPCAYLLRPHSFRRFGKMISALRKRFDGGKAGGEREALNANGGIANGVVAGYRDHASRFDEGS